MVQKGRPLPQPECGFLSNTWKWIIQGEARVDKARDFIGKRHLGREQQKEPRRIALPCGLQSQVLWWWDSFPGCLWPIIQTQGPFWLGPHIAQSRWMPARILGVGRTRPSPFNLFQILPVGGFLVHVPIPGLPVIIKLTQIVPSQSGWLQSICFPQQWVNYPPEFCELLWQISWTQGEGHGNLWSIASLSETQVTAWTCDWHPKQRAVLWEWALNLWNLMLSQGR